MRFQVKTGKPEKQRSKVAVVPVFESGILGTTAKAIDKLCGKAISSLIKAGDITGKSGEMLLLTETGDMPTGRVLLVGCGKKDEFDRQQFRKAVQAICATLAKKPYTDALIYLAADGITNAGAYRAARIIAETWHHQTYKFQLPGQAAGKPKAPALKSINIAVDSKHANAAKQGLHDGNGIGQGMSLTRDLGNTPSNYCTPSYLAKQAKALAKNEKKLTTKVLNEAEIKKLGMGSFLSVTAGSKEPAKFIIMQYQGAAKTVRPVVIVGKGITFDTGGISLKPPSAMDEMKFDMSGAASAFGVMRAAIEIGLKINLVVLVPTCENMPSATATKPGDVVTSMSGQTIEVLNTDAEGRLILCDALTYAKRFKPAALIDIATLTGACVVALGKYRMGLLANSDELANKLLDAGESADDPAWRLPLDKHYNDQLKSNFADMANIGGRDAGTITAACFLSRFTAGMNWAHLDIAGVAYHSGARKGSTGRPVQLLIEYLLNR
jgi:leucyl aminopeptidase